MVSYAQKCDPWPFHVDAEAATAISFGGLVASAGYTFSCGGDGETQQRHTGKAAHRQMTLDQEILR
jgi:acyl dehydratase